MCLLKTDPVTDTGSNCPLVRRDILPRDVVFCGGTVDVFCVHGDKVEYPIAEVTVNVEGQQYRLSVGVFEQLPYWAVLGCDLPVLAELIAKQSREAKASGIFLICLLQVQRPLWSGSPQLGIGNLRVWHYSLLPGPSRSGEASGNRSTAALFTAKFFI